MIDHELVDRTTTAYAVDALLDAYVLAYARHQREVHKITSMDFDPRNSPGNIAHFKHAWYEDLVENGRVKEGDLLALVPGSKILNCPFVERVLPKILQRLVGAGQLRKNMDDTYSAVIE